MKTHHALKSVFVLAVVLLGCTHLVSAQIVFDHRENVDLLNSDLVSLTSNTTNPSSLIMSIDQASFWEGAGTSANITMDLGAIQNVKTVEMFNQFGLAIPNGTIQVAPSLSGPWTTETATITDPQTAQENIVLDSAVDTRYVRVVANSTTGGGGRWVLNDLRVFGDTGTLAAGNHLDLISSSGLTKLGTPDWVTVTPGAGVSNGGGPAAFANDNPSNISRKDFFGMSTGESILFNFDRNVSVGTFGFTQAGGFRDSSPTFEYELLGSADGGATFPYVLLDHTGAEPGGPTFVPLQQGFTGNAFEFKIVSTTVTDGGFNGLRFGDFALLAPEPTSCVLLAGGSIMLLRRRRRCAAAATRKNRHQ